jgi:hypothetical protein
VANTDRLNSLMEQTTFLLEKQKELFDKTSKVFGGMFEVAEKKLKSIDQNARKQDAEDLKAIQKFVSDHKQKSAHGIQEDIEFLNEQIAALAQIKSIEDGSKREELLDMVIPKEEKIPDTAAFKKMITDDLASNFRDLDLMFDDMKSAIEEDDIHEIKLLLEAIKDQEENQEHEEHGCSSCSGCKQSCDQAIDVFGDFSEQAKEKQKKDDGCDCNDCGCGCSDCDK